MATEVVMPKMGLTMTEGKITRWLKKEGEQVTKGDPLLEVMTEKIVTEVEAPGTGTLVKIFNFPEEVVPVGVVIAVIAAEGENVEEIIKKIELTRAGEDESEIAQESIQEKKAVAAGAQAVAKEEELEAEQLQRLKISPLARRLATKDNISARELRGLRGTGPGGRIVKKDVLAFVKRQKEKKAPLLIMEDRIEPLSELRKTIARRMTASWTSTPHFYLEAEVEAGNLLKMRRIINDALKNEKVKVSITDLLIKIVGSVLSEHRYMNVSYTEEGLIYKGEINIGVAVALETGLIVPVLKNADQKGLRKIRQENKELIARAREGKLSLDDISGGTFTVSNLGMFTVDAFTAIINPPECAILSVGRVIEKSIYLNDEILMKPFLRITLGLDHRAIDGAQGAKFLQALAGAIENPYLLLL